MKVEIYSLYDRAVGVYGRPIFAPAYGGALRDLKTAVNAGDQSNLCMHSADFDLFLLGTFEDSSATWTLLPRPELKINCGALRDNPLPPPENSAEPNTAHSYDDAVRALNGRRGGPVL